MPNIFLGMAVFGAGVAAAVTAGGIGLAIREAEIADSGGYDLVYAESVACSGPTWCDECYLDIRWGLREQGFGQLLIYVRDGQLRCENEAMSRNFCRAVLRKVANGLCPPGRLEALSMAFFPEEKARPSIAVLSSKLTECWGEFEKPLRFISGGFTLQVELESGQQEKVVVRKEASQKSFVLVSKKAPDMVRAAFDRLALDMQLDDPGPVIPG